MCSRVKMIARMIYHSFMANKGLFVLYIVSSCMHAGTVICEALVPDLFINGVLSAGSLRFFLLLCMIFAVFVIASSFLNGFANCISGVLWDYTYGYNNYLMIQKAGKISPVCYEDSDKLDDIQKAMDGANAASFIANIYMSIICFYIPSLVGLLIYYARTSYVLMVLLMISVLPNLYAKNKKEKIYDQLSDVMGGKKRKEKAFKESIIGRYYNKETRHLQIQEYLLGMWREKFRDINDSKIASKKQTVRIEFFCRLISLALYVCMFGMLLFYYVSSKITLGKFVAVITSASTLGFLMDELVNTNMMIVMEHIGSVKNFLNFIDWEEEPVTNQLASAADDCISLQNVSFSYPNSEKCVLKNIDLTISRGEMVAIVGENGSGKTTLSKIILGLYPPTGGSITLWQPIRSDSGGKKAFQGVSIVSQNYARYQLSLRDNVAISQLEKCEDKDIIRSLEFVDAKNLESLDVILSKEFGGIDLSGGEWQKIAIARGMFKENSLILLDEPTSAIDPNKEYELYQLFKKISQGRTMVYVTHRLGSTQLADRIIVLREGEIVGQGKHEELMAGCEHYRRMFEDQKSWYTEKAQEKLQARTSALPS